MNSFISHFKPWGFALLCLLVIEASYWFAYNPPRVTWNSFLDLQFTQEESFQRLVAHDKLLAAENLQADIIQVGDSSGLHGVQPPIVMSYLPGYTYLNLSVATNLGFSGYLNMAKVQLQRNPGARYLVLYTSPIGGVPRRILWDDDQKLMASLIHNEFLSPLHRLIQLPSLSARRDMIDRVYYLGYHFRQKDAPLSNNRGYLAFLDSFRQSNGWTRETDVEGDVPSNIYKNILPGIDLNQPVDPNLVRATLRRLPKVTDERYYDWRTLTERSYFDVVYDAFADLAKANGVKLILVFNPLPESLRRPEFEELMDWRAIESGIARFRQRHPEVVVTDFAFWPDDRFSVFSHISTSASIESSRRVAEMLARIVEPRAAGSPVSQRWLAEPEQTVDIDFRGHFAGYGWTDTAGTTNRFPMQFIGPRGKAWLFVRVKPGMDYHLRASFQGAPTAVEAMKLTANGIPAKHQASGRSGDQGWIEWLLPAAEVERYSGWLNLEFHTGPVEPALRLAFQRIGLSSVSRGDGGTSSENILRR
jgi:hypothetical protein